jgi:uncharacterized protein (DUF1501 family)
MDRRKFLAGCLSGIGAAMLSRGEAATTASPRLVFVFLRGGVDALSLFSPRGAAWTALQGVRPTIAMTGPLAFSPDLYAHPQLAPLLASDVVTNLSVVLHAGGVVDTRSHFDQQYRIETGSNAVNGTSGFLARLAQALSVQTAAVDRSAPASLLGVNPLVMSDPARVQNTFTVGALDPRYSRAQRLGMYRGAASVVGSAAIDSAAAQALAEGNTLAGELSGTTLASLTSLHGYAPASVFGGRLALTAKLMTSSLDPRLFAVDGEQFWDSHTNQLTNDSTSWTTLWKSVLDLGTNLAAFRRDLVARGLWGNTTVVVMSEFGRTVGQNQGAGTDHGRGGVMLVMGGKIRGFADPGYLGRRAWTLPSTIDVSTPLSVVHDYRTVLAEILEKQFAMTTVAARGVFLNQATASYLGVVR